MSRAAVLIGVNRTGGLPALNDAASGARSMEGWALSQGIPQRRVLVFTDEGGPVDIGDIRRAIRTLVESGSIEQLIVYFAGHGVNIRYGEYWLLSDAPVDPSAAVNVEGSIVLARRSGIPHVVFISDACRSAAEGIQAQGITGGEIFPNDPVPGPEQAVDIFFATTLGRPALEVRDAVAASASFRAVYTQALLDAVSGRIPAVLKESERAGRRLHLVQPRPLKTCLLDELPRRLDALGLPAAVSQVPDARITSDDQAWLAQLESLPSPQAPAAAAPSALPSAAPSALPSSPAAPRASPQARLEAELDAVLRRGDEMLAGQRPADTPGATAALPAARPSARPTARPAAEVATRRDAGACSVVLAGAHIAEAITTEARIDFSRTDPARVAVDLVEPACNLLLIIGDGSGVLVPVLKGFNTTLAFDDGELADIACEPLQGTPPWDGFSARADHLRELRRLVAGAARSGIFHPDAAAAAAVARQMRYAAGAPLSADDLADPALALHVAYALHDLRMADQIRDLARSLARDLSISFFDVALLAGELPRGDLPRGDLPPGDLPRGALPPGARPLLAGSAPAPRPPFPMLARGWALLSACGIALPDGLGDIQRELLPSLWTHFNPAGASRLRDLMLARRL